MLATEDSSTHVSNAQIGRRELGEPLGAIGARRLRPA
jgi:hypothetical protein